MRVYDESGTLFHKDEEQTEQERKIVDEEMDRIYKRFNIIKPIDDTQTAEGLFGEEIVMSNNQVNELEELWKDFQEDLHDKIDSLDVLEKEQEEEKDLNYFGN